MAVPPHHQLCVQQRADHLLHEEGVALGLCPGSAGALAPADLPRAANWPPVAGSLRHPAAEEDGRDSGGVLPLSGFVQTPGRFLAARAEERQSAAAEPGRSGAAGSPAVPARRGRSNARRRRPAPEAAVRPAARDSWQTRRELAWRRSGGSKKRTRSPSLPVGGISSRREERGAIAAAARGHGFGLGLRWPRTVRRRLVGLQVKAGGEEIDEGGVRVYWSRRRGSGLPASGDQAVRDRRGSWRSFGHQPGFAQPGLGHHERMPPWPCSRSVRAWRQHARHLCISARPAVTPTPECRASWPGCGLGRQHPDRPAPARPCP